MWKPLSEAALRKFTYDEYLNDHTLDTHLPSIAEPFCLSDAHSARSTAGVLDRLPLEVVHMILKDLDFDSLHSFRITSRKSFEIVNSLSAYGILIKHARHAVRCASFVGISDQITCSQLYEKLCRPHCETCGDFGGYLYLITCRRVCFLCLSEDKVFLPLTRTDACRKFGLDRRSVDSVPHIITRGGKYSPNEKKLKDGLALFDYDVCHEIGVIHHGSEEEMNKHVGNTKARQQEEYERRISSRRPGGQRSVRRPANGAFDAESGNPRRFAAIVRIPWYDASVRLVEWGFHCQGCERSRNRGTNCRKKYYMDSFCKHIEEFGLLQSGQHEKEVE